MMAWVGLACFVEVTFIPVLHEVIHPGAVVCLQRDFLKQSAWVVFYPMPPCCWFCSAAGPASVMTWKNVIPATFYTTWGNSILLMELHFILGRVVIRAGTSWKDNGISSGLVGMLLVGMEHALGASKRKKKKGTKPNLNTSSISNFITHSLILSPWFSLFLGAFAVPCFTFPVQRFSNTRSCGLPLAYARFIEKQYWNVFSLLSQENPFLDLESKTTCGFEKDMKLEAVDPKHPSYICVCTVVRVKGTRLRLHFDGWSESYDFWTSADSPFLFHVGWCEKNGQKLHPPRSKRILAQRSY